MSQEAHTRTVRVAHTKFNKNLTKITCTFYGAQMLWTCASDWALPSDQPTNADRPAVYTHIHSTHVRECNQRVFMRADQSNEIFILYIYFRSHIILRERADSWVTPAQMYISAINRKQTKRKITQNSNQFLIWTTTTHSLSASTDAFVFAFYVSFIIGLIHEWNILSNVCNTKNVSRMTTAAQRECEMIIADDSNRANNRKKK